MCRQYISFYQIKEDFYLVYKDESPTKVSVTIHYIFCLSGKNEDSYDRPTLYYYTYHTC